MGKINGYIKQYAKVCDDLGIKYEFYGRLKSWLILTKKNGKPAFIYKSGTPLNQHNANRVTRSKRMTTTLLQAHKVPTPQQFVAESAETVTQLFHTYKDIVVKPLDSKGGNGVTVLPKETELEQAFKESQKFSKTTLVETFVSGFNYRFLVLDGVVLSAILRKPPFIIGNGIATVEQLLTELNIQNTAHNIPTVKMGFETERVVAAQGYTLQSVLEDQKMIFVRLTANLSQGSTTEDITDTVHEKHRQVAIEAAAALGLRFAGVDIICEDITSEKSVSYVIEVNTSPGLKMHYYEEKGAKRNVAQTIIKAIWES